MPTLRRRIRLFTWVLFGSRPSFFPGKDEYEENLRVLKATDIAEENALALHRAGSLNTTEFTAAVFRAREQQLTALIALDWTDEADRAAHDLTWRRADPADRDRLSRLPVAGAAERYKPVHPNPPQEMPR